MIAIAETLEKERISHAIETSLNHKKERSTPEIHVSAYDIDKNVFNTLNENIANSSSEFKKSDYEIISEDFLEKTSFEYTWKINETYIHEIMRIP